MTHELPFVLVLPYVSTLATQGPKRIKLQPQQHYGTKNICIMLALITFQSCLKRSIIHLKMCYLVKKKEKKVQFATSLHLLWNFTSTSVSVYPTSWPEGKEAIGSNNKDVSLTTWTNLKLTNHSSTKNNETWYPEHPYNHTPHLGHIYTCYAT